MSHGLCKNLGREAASGSPLSPQSPKAPRPDLARGLRPHSRKGLGARCRYRAVTPAPQSRSRLIVPTEPLLPWLAASVLAASAYTAGIVAGLAGARMPWVVLTVACCSVLTATVLVWWRAKRVQREVRQTELSRPAPEELATWAADSTLVDAGERHLPPYGEGMLRYSAAVVELLEHAVTVALEHELDATEIAAARDDAAALNNLLTAMAAEPARLDKVAKVHTICSLWEAGQERTEQEAAALDPEFHRRWRARNLAVLRLRHGDRPRRDEPALPYRE